MLARPRGSARWRNDDGVAAVEFALVLPLLVMLVLGVLTTGIAYSHSLGLANAVREGSRFAAITPYPPTSGNWGADVIARTRATQFDDPGVSSRICVDLVKQGSGALVSKQCEGPSLLGAPANFVAPSGTPTGGCAVRVWAARSFTINALLFNTTRTMKKTSIAVYERSPCGT